jgi:16S rRNA (guanine527-N7)-methyltransferase
MVAMKGVYPADELDRLPSNISVRDVVRLKIPGLDAQRHAVIMTKALI